MKISFPWWVAWCLVVVSCAGDGAYKLGEDMSDAGRVLLGDALVEGGEALQDAGMMARSDARADDAQVMVVPCSTHYIRREETGPQIRIWHRYYAEVRSPLLGPGTYRGVDAVVCDADMQESRMRDWDCSGRERPGTTCTGNLGAPALCREGTIHILDGVIRVLCGETDQWNLDGSGIVGPLSPETGYRYRTARIVIR